MVSTQDKFILNIKEELNEFIEKEIKVFTLDVTANIVEANPVLTGWSQANWVPEIGAPFTATAGTKMLAEEGNIDRSPQKAGIQKVATSYTLDQGKIYISNNVPYITELNEGSSLKAPAGFVQLAIAQAIQEASK